MRQVDGSGDIDFPAGRYRDPVPRKASLWLPCIRICHSLLFGRQILDLVHAPFFKRREPYIRNTLARGITHLLCNLAGAVIHLDIEAALSQRLCCLNSLVTPLPAGEDDHHLCRALRPYFHSSLGKHCREQARQSKRNTYPWQLAADERTGQIIIAATCTDRAIGRVFHQLPLVYRTCIVVKAASNRQIGEYYSLRQVA